MSVKNFIDEKLQEIDEQITELEDDKIFKKAMKIKAQIDVLKAARAALMGAGPKLTGGSTNGRMTQMQVIGWMQTKGEPGTVFTVEEICKGLHASDSVIRGHLNRGNGERFLTPERGKWALRDPEKGINTVEDLA